MKIFIDSANLTEVEMGLKRGFAHGVTTNPSLLAKEPKGSFLGHIDKIAGLILLYGRPEGMHLSIEVFSRDPAEIVRQAKAFVDHFKSFERVKLSIKVQIGWNELETISKLSALGISVNCTACMTVTQAMMAAHAGARYVSLFWGRIRDGGIEDSSASIREDLKKRKVLDDKDFDSAFVVRSVRELIDRNHLNAEIIIGSIRSMLDVRDAGLAGAHIVTIPPKFFPDMANHFKTDQIVDTFMTEFQQWLS